MIKTLSALALLCPLALSTLPVAPQVEIEWVTVGNAGNPAAALCTDFLI